MTSTNKSIFLTNSQNTLKKPIFQLILINKVMLFRLTLGMTKAAIYLIVTRINDGSRLTLFTGFPFVPNSENWLSLNNFSSYLCYSKAVAAVYSPKDSQRFEIALSTDIYDAYDPSEQVYYSIFNFIEFYKSLRSDLEKLTSSIILLS